MSSILCINTGSSSVKFSLYHEEDEIFSGQFDNSGEIPFDDIFEALPNTPEIIAHRVVHGGEQYKEAVLIDDAVIARLSDLTPLAPGHQPRALAGIEAVRARYPEIPQYACFDTAFHREMPELAQRYPLPRRVLDAGVRRYGFHGLSYESILSELEGRIPERLIIAHLGNGCSLCALKNGRPVDTTMGFTPAGGVMMGRRPGDLDPGVILYLLREGKYSVEELDQLVNRESGLLGVSGIDFDMRKLRAMADTDENAAFAIDLYCYQIRKAIGAFSAVLGGLDLMVFTGGIGENSPGIRDQVMAGLEYLDCDTEVIPTCETLSMVRQVMRKSKSADE